MQDAFARQNKLVVGRIYGVPGGDPLAGSVSGVRIVRGQQAMTGPIADRTGVYTLNGGRFRIMKGDPLPEGAEMEPDADAPSETGEQRTFASTADAALQAANERAAAEAKAAEEAVATEQKKADEAAAAEAKKAEDAAAKKAAAEAKQAAGPTQTGQGSGPSETA